MSLERIDFIKIGIVFSGFITGNGFRSGRLPVSKNANGRPLMVHPSILVDAISSLELKLSVVRFEPEIVWIQKNRIISFVLFIVFYFGRDKYSILRISKEVSKDSGPQESFERRIYGIIDFVPCNMNHRTYSIA